MVAPSSGVVTRPVGAVYGNSPDFNGVVMVTNTGETVKMFYVSPDSTLLGQSVDVGQPIGLAQDLTVRYPGTATSAAIPNHVHVEIYSAGHVQDPSLYIPVP